MSVRPSAWNKSAQTGRIFMKFDILGFLKNVSKQFKFYYNLTRIKGNLHQYPQNRAEKREFFSGKRFRGTQSRHFVFTKFFFEIRNVCDIMREKIMVLPDMP